MHAFSKDVSFSHSVHRPEASLHAVVRCEICKYPKLVNIWWYKSLPNCNKSIHTTAPEQQYNSFPSTTPIFRLFRTLPLSAIPPMGDPWSVKYLTSCLKLSCLRLVAAEDRVFPINIWWWKTPSPDRKLIALRLPGIN